jgi:cell division protein FtsL
VSRGVKLRRVLAWMGVMLCVALLALGHVRKQQVHASLSREVVKTSRERDALATEVLLMETETRGLRHYSRLESFARQRLGLLNPGPPVMILPGGQLQADVAGVAGKSGKADKADKASGGDPIRSARWKGFSR